MFAIYSVTAMNVFCDTYRQLEPVVEVGGKQRQISQAVASVLKMYVSHLLLLL